MLVNTMEFNITGVTFENDNKQDIQQKIKQILNEYKKFDDIELFGGYTDKEMLEEGILEINEFDEVIFECKIVEGVYKKEKCFKVYIKNYNNEYVHVGYVPKSQIDELSRWLSRKDLTYNKYCEIAGR